MACKRTNVAGNRLISYILFKVKGVKSTNTADKNAFKAYMTMQTMEAIVTRQLTIIRHLADNNLELGGWSIAFLTV